MHNVYAKPPPQDIFLTLSKAFTIIKIKICLKIPYKKKDLVKISAIS